MLRFRGWTLIVIGSALEFLAGALFLRGLDYWGYEHPPHELVFICTNGCHQHSSTLTFGLSAVFAALGLGAIALAIRITVRARLHRAAG